MFLGSFVTGPWQANCYVVGKNPGECVVIDPGVYAFDTLAESLPAQGLTPKAVIATHGHIDHIADAAKLADRYQVALWIHPADRHLLTDPASGLGADSIALLQQVLPGPFTEPAAVELYEDGDVVSAAGLDFSITHAPGHTEGSSLLTIDYEGEGPSHVVFTGDVLFAGSIGRTDMPGGSKEQMDATLRGPVWQLPDTSAILPGHGPQSVMAAERASNPFLRGLAR
ncbi:MAG: MBL fold metallo-hydrolase [Propionibacteriaceae bacterium]|jgi:glyoxylase-like metal-dependent hydrolase (beta-lactamase superfamily II)|nr:MBL fold metallo-hydrolase [Propionibacteriaceae bacterium]